MLRRRLDFFKILGVVTLLSVSTVHANNAELSISTSQAIQTAWEDVVYSIEINDLRRASDLLFQLEKLRDKTGFSAFDDYSLYLVERGIERLKIGDLSSASFFARRALKLSPDSVPVLLKSLRLVTQTREAALWDQLMKILRNLPAYYGLILAEANSLLYGIMLALSFALYAAYAILFGQHAVVLMRRSARKFPPLMRGWLSPIVVATLLAAPCILGLTWCICVWGVVLFVLLPEKRLLLGITAVVMMLWGALIPLKENIQIWGEDKGVQTMLRTAAGSYAHWDQAMLKALVNRRQSDAMAHYTLGQLLRREGRYDEAHRSFSLAQDLMGTQPWTEAQLGILAFLRGDARQAQSHFGAAEGLGLDSAAFAFNYSKVFFKLGDTETGRQYIEQATAADRKLVEALNYRENEFGMDSALALAEISLPLKYVMRSAMVSNSEAKQRSDQIAAKLMPGMTPPYLFGAGAFFMLLYFMSSQRRGKVRLQTYYTRYRFPAVWVTLLRLVPGASFVMAGHTAWGFAALAATMVMAMPIAGWPLEMGAIAAAAPGFEYYYAAGVTLLAFILVYIGSESQQEVLDA